MTLQFIDLLCVLFFCLEWFRVTRSIASCFTRMSCPYQAELHSEARPGIEDKRDEEASLFFFVLIRLHFVWTCFPIVVTDGFVGNRV